MLLVGLTGGIASGKSTVAAILLERGAELIDADELARDAVEPGREAWEKVVEHFGAEILRADGSIDRERLGAIVFADAEKRRRLNEIVHPRVAEAMAEHLERLRDTDAIVVCDIPLLAEAGDRGMFEVVVVVEASEPNRLARLMRDRGSSRADALARIAAQATEEERRKLADVVIDNDGDLERLRRQVDALWASLEARRH